MTSKIDLSCFSRGRIGNHLKVREGMLMKERERERERERVTHRGICASSDHGECVHDENTVRYTCALASRMIAKNADMQTRTEVYAHQ